jgi:hypothetical protein
MRCSMNISPDPSFPPPIIDAHVLREWADAAASYRDDGPFWLVYREGESPTILPGPADSPPTGAVFGVATREVEKRLKPGAVIVDCDGSTRDLADAYDAVFWSEAAVEKFVLPYYASKSMWDAASELEKLSKYWYGTVPVEDESGDLLDGVPYALMHTPDSDWNGVSIDGIGPVSAELHLLVKAGSVLRAVRLCDLDPKHPERADRAPRTLAATAAA